MDTCILYLKSNLVVISLIMKFENVVPPLGISMFFKAGAQRFSFKQKDNARVLNWELNSKRKKSTSQKVGRHAFQTE